MRRIATLVLVVAACALLSACGSSAAFSLPSSPKAERAAIVAAALGQKSVNYDETDAIDTFGDINTTADVNADSGVETSSFKTSFDKGKIEIRLVDHTIYARGNAGAVESDLGVPSARAKRYAGRWISIPKGDKLYPSLSSGLTLASLVHATTPEGKLKVSTSDFYGTRVLDVQGRSDSRGYELEVQASGDPLPVASSYWEKPGGPLVSRWFSNWNEPVHVQAPASSIPIATVRGG